MKMYEKLGMDLTTEQGLLEAIQFCPYKYSKANACTYMSCSECKTKYLIQEVKEEKYRPYKDTQEMIEDYIEKNEVTFSTYELPLIWVKEKAENRKLLISGFKKDYALFGGTYLLSLDCLFNNYTYLDGSPCGKKE